MADTKKKSTTKYKFGQRELDMQDYIENIGYNVQNYLEDRRKNRGWTDEQVQEFSSAYNRLMNAFKQQLADGSNRFSTNDLGVITDSQGEFNNTDNDDIDPVGSQYYYNDKGERITTDDYNNLKDKKKKKYKTFNANRQVAEYFRIIGNKLKDIPKPETSKFDLDKHGFVAWWNKKYNPAGGKANIIPFLDKDPIGTDGKRPVNNRAKIAAGWMNEYLDWLKDQDLDYSNYDQFKDYDTYSAKGRALAQKWNDGVWDADDLIEGQAFGISKDFSEGFFTQDEKPYLTNAQKEAINAEKKAKEEKEKAEQIKKDKQAWIDSQIAAFNNSKPIFTSNNPYTSTADTSNLYDANGNLNEENYYKAWGSNFIDSKTNRLNTNALNQYMQNFVQNPFGAQYKNDFARNIAGLIYHNIAQPIASGKYQGMFYIPSKSDQGVNRALVYDPNTKQMFYTFIGDIPTQWEARRNKYDEEHGITKPNETYMWKQGGIIKMQFGGNFGEVFSQGRNTFIENRAKSQGKTIKQYEADNRTPMGKKNALQTNNGWTTNDSLRVGAILGDLTSMGLAFTPATIASSAVGAGSTTAHLAADIAEDGLDWGDAGRALFGYSMDALGLIPGVGGVTKAAKIGRAIKVVAPKVIAAIGAAGTLANSGAILGSLKKAMGDEHLTVEDFRNITQGLMFVMGGTGAAARKIHTMRGGKGTLAKGPQGTTNSIALQIKNKKTGKVETRTFNADQAKAIKEAKDNAGILTAAKLGKDEELVTTTSLRPHFQWIRENGKWRSPIHTVQGRAEVMPVRLGHDGKYYAKRGQFNTDIAIENTATELQTQLNNFRTNTGVTKSVAELKAIQKKLKKTQDDYAKKVKTINAELSKLRSTKTPDKKLIRAKQKELNDAREAITAMYRQISSKPSWISRSFKTKDKKLEEYIESIKGLEAQLGQTNRNWSEMVSETNTSKNVKETFKNILREYGSYKEGGKFTVVKKYQLGDPITNVKGTAKWFEDMYSHKSMQDWIKTWNTNNYEDFNKLQDSWFNNLKNTKYDPNNPEQARGSGIGQSMDVLSRQKEWDKTGTNAAIEAAVAAGKLVRNGGTKDNPQGKYQDGYFGAQEYLRHGGNADSWFNHENELNELKKFFKSRNLDYFQDEDTGMYKLRLLNSNGTPQNPNVSSDLSPESDSSQQQGDQVNQKGQFDQIRKFNIDPMVGSITHNTYANTINDKMTNRQIDAIRKGLTLYDFKNNTKYLEGDFDSLMGRQQAAGQLMHLADQPLTSDGNVQKSAYIDSVVKALDYIRQGNAANNQVLKKSKDEIWKLKYDDKAFNYDVAMKNRQSIDDLIENIANVKNAHDAKEFTNNDILWQEMMYGTKQKANKREVMEEQFALSDIKNDVKYNLSDYARQSGIPLSKDEEEAWQAVISGDKTYSELGGDDKEAEARLQKAYMSAARKAVEIEQNKIRGYYNIPQSNYSSVRQVASENWYRQKPKNENGGTLELKNGSKIAVAKIRERSKDADRFYKTVKDIQDRIDKAIARVDKKMYKRRDPEKRRK